MAAGIKTFYRRLPFFKKSSWHSIFSPTETASVGEITRKLALRLTTSEIIEKAVQSAEKQTGYPGSTHWHPYSVSQGHAGIALFFGHLDLCFPNEGWDKHAHNYLTKASLPVETIETPHLGLHTGLAGLAYTTLYLSKEGVFSQTSG